MAHTYYLENVEPFNTMPREDALRLLSEGKMNVYQPGQQVIRRGDPGDAMFVIAEGAVDIPVKDPEGKLRYTNYLRKGDVFGEVALLTKEARTADVYASSEGPCTCLVIEASTVDRLCRRYPSVARFLTEILGERLLRSGHIRQVGKYNIGTQIGRGGMTRVYEGFHGALKRPVAIKMLSHDLVYHADFAERFKQEGELIAELRHPHIVEVYDLEFAYGTWFIIMEMLQGLDLDQKLKRHGPMDFDEIRRALWQTLTALKFAHERGIVHRDIKPDNIVLQPDGNVKLVDFGIAVSGKREPSASIEGFMFVGTPHYSPPESILGAQIDGRADLYALGQTAYALITGKPPYGAESLEEVLDLQLKAPMPDCRKLRPDAPDDLVAFIAGTTAKRPNDRYATAELLLTIFSDWGKTGSVGGGAGEGKVLAVFHTPERSGAVDRILEEAQTKLNALQGVSASWSSVLSQRE